MPFQVSTNFNGQQHLFLLFAIGKSRASPYGKGCFETFIIVIVIIIIIIIIIIIVFFYYFSFFCFITIPISSFNKIQWSLHNVDDDYDEQY